MPNGAVYQNAAPGYRGPWVDQLLQAIGAPTTDSNRAALRLWAAAEGTVNSNNPLAISTRFPGSTTCIAQCNGSNPIMAYNSMANGLNATAGVLQNHYPGILAAFRQDAGTGPIFSAINGSPWCPGCSNGSYPATLASFNNNPGAGGNIGIAPPGTPTGTYPGSPNNPPAGSNQGGCSTFSLPVLGCADKYIGLILTGVGAFMVIGGILLVAGVGLKSLPARAVRGAVGGGGGSSSQRSKLPGPRQETEAEADERARQENERVEGFEGDSAEETAARARQRRDLQRRRRSLRTRMAPGRPIPA